MSFSFDRRRYVDLFGPTTGDLVRLADTALQIRVEKDLTTPGDELKFGGGKTVRDDQGQTPGVGDDRALDLVITGALIVDVTGIYKADIGVKHGRIVGIGKAGNPHRMIGVLPHMIVGVTTEVISAEGCLVTAGGIDSHIHFICPQQADEAIASGVTTFVGGGTGPASGTKATTCTPGAWNLARMLQGTDDIPLNIGFTGKGNTSQPEGLADQIRAGCIGLKLHEDWGTTPRTIATALDVADAEDIQITLHTDTLNESSYVDETIAAFGGRTVHSYHSEGAGGGHAPDIIKICGVANVLPSSTNPTRPFTRNTLDEHLDMLMVCHHLSAKIPEDVAFAESRIRGETIAAEDILHDLGAISMMSSDSQAMGRVGEVVTRTWQTAHKMKEQRGSLPEDSDGADNFRVRRYLAKYTINPAIAHGFGHEVGSIEIGKLADLCIWKPALFGVRPELVLKGGFIAWSQMGDANASIPPCQPYIMRPMFGARGRAVGATSLVFLSQRALREGTTEALGLHKIRSGIRDVRGLGKKDMRLNDALPHIEVDAETYEVRADGVHLTCEPLDVLPLAQRFSLFLPSTTMDPLLLLQLADSAFPTGGFAHSAGLEAALGHGYLRSSDDLRRALEALLWTTGTLSLPYVRAAHQAPDDALTLARRCETQLSLPVTNRASRAQGRALLDALTRSFALPWALALRDAFRLGGDETHLAPIFGASLAQLGAREDETARLFTFTTLRSAIGAAVRLNIVGPFEGQRLQADLAPHVHDVLARTAHLAVDDAAGASPLWEIVAGTHDRLRTRLFQS